MSRATRTSRAARTTSSASGAAPATATSCAGAAITIEQGTIIRYLVRKSEDGTYRKPGAQPPPQSTPPRLALGYDGPDTPPSEVFMPRGQSPKLVDWRGALEGCQVDWGTASVADGCPTRPTENEQPSDPAAKDNIDTQSTHLSETPDANGPDAQPRDVPTPQRDHPERLDWRVDLADNAYKYERLVEQGGSAEQTTEGNTSFRTTATLNLQPIKLLTRWLDELPGSGGGFDRESSATWEHTRCLGSTDSPVSHHNSWNRAEVRPRCDTPASVYDGGGQRVPETPPDGDLDRDISNTYYVVQPICETPVSVYDGGG